MKKIILLLSAFVLLCSHDMFLKMDTYYLQPNQAAMIDLFNGTFEKSDNIITRNRMVDVSLVGNGLRARVDTSQWAEKNDVTILNFTSGKEGTWVAGVSTRPRNIELAAKAFNDYLEHDGVLDMLQWRKENNQLDSDAVEKYSKHVKTVFQVGNKRTKDWQTVLGYPVEFVPLSNPYNAKAGDSIQLQLLWQGKPLSNQIVYAGSQEDNHVHNHAHSHDENSDHHHQDVTQLRTNSEGIVTLNLAHRGVWYLRTIHMQLSEEPDLTHESNWATITFEIGSPDGSAHEEHSHSHSHSHDDNHSHSHSHGISKYLYLLGGAMLLIALIWGVKSRFGR